jgi:hypothetical protein
LLKPIKSWCQLPGHSALVVVTNFLLASTNTLAFYNTESIGAVKSFMSTFRNL